MTRTEDIRRLVEAGFDPAIAAEAITAVKARERRQAETHRARWRDLTRGLLYLLAMKAALGTFVLALVLTQ
jgi:hypothetical protein